MRSRAAASPSRLAAELRPEFVAAYATPLSSGSAQRSVRRVSAPADAFSGFAAKEADYAAHCSAVADATAHLHGTVIPRFADWLARTFGTRRPRDAEPTDASLPSSGEPEVPPRRAARLTRPPQPQPVLRLARAMHEAGISLRHLGAVRRHLAADEMELRGVLLIGSAAPRRRQL